MLEYTYYLKLFVPFVVISFIENPILNTEY